MGARYDERASRFVGAVLWAWSGRREPSRPVLPDGCMDLLWVGGRLVVAGPDTHAFTPAGTLSGSCAGIRFAPGTAPALLGVPAHELRDRRVPLDTLWPGGEVRRLTERTGSADDPTAALEDIALRRAMSSGAAPPDPLTAAVAAQLRQGRSVAATADAVGLGARQLHRHSLAAFGYGPKTLARVLRLQRALDLVRAGTPYAAAACATGYADQAHLAREMRGLTGTTLGAHLAATGHAERAANSETAQPSGSRTTA
ncbi:AraC family transcriptional regulator [Streptomyces sp. NPDC006288]|uniref:AraC family transcriptional regulator n=1 Tax=Streptomyces sp. NPDC006288 TaxID=3156743 RepID=UPI0033B667B0